MVGGVDGVDHLAGKEGTQRSTYTPGMVITQVDAFTDAPFSGNPAAVCLLEEPRDAGWMQCVAGEMNLSETAFLRRRPDGAFDLRWFTPAVEVDLCGHATLASAHVLREQGVWALGGAVRFHTRSGVLTARGCDGWIELDFPADPIRGVAPPPGLIEALGVRPRHLGRGPGSTTWPNSSPKRPCARCVPTCTGCGPSIRAA